MQKAINESPESYHAQEKEMHRQTITTSDIIKQSYKETKDLGGNVIYFYPEKRLPLGLQVQKAKAWSVHKLWIKLSSF